MGVRRCVTMFNSSILMIQWSDHVKNNKIPNTLPLPALLWMGVLKCLVVLNSQIQNGRHRNPIIWYVETFVPFDNRLRLKSKSGRICFSSFPNHDWSFPWIPRSSHQHAKLRYASAFDTLSIFSVRHFSGRSPDDKEWCTRTSDSSQANTDAVSSR